MYLIEQWKFKNMYDRDILVINLISPKHRTKKVDGTHISVSFTKTNERLRPTTPNVTPQWNSTSTFVSRRETIEQVKDMTRRRGRRIQHGLAWPPSISIQGNIFHSTINPNQESPHKKKILQYTGINELAGTTPVLSARSSLFLFCRFCLEHVKTVQLTDDFWHHQLAPFVETIILPLPKQRVVWYSIARWQPTTITEMNHPLLLLKDKYIP